MRRLLVVVDTQRDFIMPDGELYVGGAEAPVAPMNEMLASLSRVETAGVLLTFDTHERVSQSSDPDRQGSTLAGFSSEGGYAEHLAAPHPSKLRKIS